MPNNNEHFINQSSDTLTLEGSESYYSIRQKGLINKINEDTITHKILEKALNEAFRKKISKFSDSQNTHIQTPGSPGVCRICLQSDWDDSNKCLTPCFCRGSISKVHRLCLQTWLLQAESNECEICKFKYKTRRISKYSLLGSIKAWLFNNDSPDEINELLYDGFMLLTITPLLTLVTYVGFYVTSYFCNVETQAADPLLSRVLAFTVYTSIMCTNFIFSLWSTYRIQHHANSWLNFYKRNQEVIVVVDPKIPEN